MRLESIKLVGFKSFVDPTTVHLPSHLMAVVGPNGCGKSNIIDAVRWVMGESSAKQLRGESSTDVIFNGSSARKPVGQASIELVFDNADGSLGGEYAQYSQIAVKRLVTRDGESTYFLNGGRCRRRDITDIFLGTGLGPRSYAIIEQGMIARLIEAKPEDLRVMLEEAAGISKYKERRRETELRIQHTRENLSRLSDLRDELSKQLDHLQRQAKTAARYQELKQQERQLKAEWLTIRWVSLDLELSSVAVMMREREVMMESAIAEMRSLEAQIEVQRSLKTEAQDHLNAVQTMYYRWGSEITRCEQNIQHHRDRKSQWVNDQAEATRAAQQIEQHLTEDHTQAEALRAEFEILSPQVDRARAQAATSKNALVTFEASLSDWKIQWDRLIQQVAAETQQTEVEQIRIQQLEKQLTGFQERREKLLWQRQQSTTIELSNDLDTLLQQCATLQQECQHLQHALAAIAMQIADQREKNTQQVEAVALLERHMQTLTGKFSSLEALQQTALGERNTAIVEWLKAHQLSEHPRLGHLLKVQEGWECAVETVLGSYLEAVCVPDVNAALAMLPELSHGTLTMVTASACAVSSPSGEGQRLIDKIQAGVDLETVLSGIYVADTLAEAIARVPGLAAHESVITQDGIWVGPQWVRVAREPDEKTGVLQRERELNELQIQMREAMSNIARAKQTLAAGQIQLHTFEQERDTCQHRYTEQAAKHAQYKAEAQVKQARIDHLHAQLAAADHESQELTQQINVVQEEIHRARAVWSEALRQLEQHETERMALKDQYLLHEKQIMEARQKAQLDSDESHRLALRHQTLETQLASLAQNTERFTKQLNVLVDRQRQLTENIASSEAPLQALEEDLARSLSERASVEKELETTRQQGDTLDHSLRELEARRAQAETSVAGLRGELERNRMTWQEIKVKGDSLREQITESGFECDTIKMQISAEATEQRWQEQLEQIKNRIDRLGAINLAAIEEYQQQVERKSYLDAQNDDLVQALTTLEEAIRKIDHETKQRFKETYDKLNENFKALFPRVFGGGEACLEMVGDDLLNSGIAVIARPPGKRNSTIHQLSGGEKSMTAIALIFAIFQLNPAPFCMLDEVDAPLDDLNIGRFCDLLKELSSQVQFIFISHNKLTIEIAQHLIGVTMNEPGVSRLVSVDVEEAVAMAAA